MKFFTLLSSSLLLASHLYAANYYVNNVVTGDANDVLIVDTDNTPLDGGIVTIGWFTSGSPNTNISNISSTISDFNIAASIAPGSYSIDLDDSVPGYYQSDIVSGTDVLSGDARIGTGVYLFAGNGTTLANSTAIALLQVGTYIADNPPAINQYTADAAIAISTPSAIVFGDTTSGINSTIATGHNAFRLQAIPEPSTTLLIVFGSMAMLRRRRD